MVENHSNCVPLVSKINHDVSLAYISQMMCQQIECIVDIEGFPMTGCMAPFDASLISFFNKNDKSRHLYRKFLMLHFCISRGQNLIFPGPWCLVTITNMSKIVFFLMSHFACMSSLA